MALVVTNPQLGVEWLRGNEHQITWTGANSAFAKLNFYLYRGAASTFLASYYMTFVGINGTFYWNPIPSTQATATDYFIRIVESD